MDLKPGCHWPADIHPSMWYARSIVNAIHHEMFQYGGVCTSAYRAQLPGGSSLHAKWRAMDVRTHHMNEGQARQFAELVKVRLGPDFDVVLEGPFATDPKMKDRPPHLHVEYDPGDWE